MSLLACSARGFQPCSLGSHRSSSILRAKDAGIDLKAELTEYLKKREELGADEAAQK